MPKDWNYFPNCTNIALPSLTANFIISLKVMPKTLMILGYSKSFFHFIRK